MRQNYSSKKYPLLRDSLIVIRAKARNHLLLKREIKKTKSFIQVVSSYKRALGKISITLIHAIQQGQTTI